jgi:hypothetical protein
MAITDIHFGRLKKWLLPVRLRQAKIAAFVNAMLHYISDFMYPAFKIWEPKSWYDLKYQSGQVAHLEKVLNDRFDPIQKRIYLSEGLHPDHVYIYTDAEQQPVFLFTDAENMPVHLYTDLEYTYGYADFVINVPNGLPQEEVSLRAVADRYKRDGKNYLIQYF